MDDRKKQSKTQCLTSNVQRPKLVGIGGLTRSGKDTVAELFIANGWYGVSLGDIIRDKSRERHKNDQDPASVANMTETANWLRGQYGADVILQEALRQYETARQKNEQYKGLVLYSIRAPIEADFILSHGGQLIWVEASDVVRHQRWLAKPRAGEEQISLAEFNAHENLQYNPQPGIPENIQMNTRYVKTHATITIENNGNDKDAFLLRAKQLL
jgi:dephospho-CoA kinase